MAQLPIPGMEEFTQVLQTGRSARAVGVLGKFLGRTVGETAAFAAGVAIGPVLGPIVQALRNTTNSHYAFVYPDPTVLADGVAQGQVPEKEARLWASFHGIGDDAFTALVNIANTGPGVSEAYLLWRRGEINEAGFRRAAKRTGLEQEWIEALVKAKNVLLSSEELAMMQQQGFVTEARANSEGLLQGVTNERQQLRFEASGLPPGIGEALEMLRRGIITATEFGQIVREGHTKTKYTDELLALKDQVLHATDYAGLRIRGWITAEESYAGGKLTGYSKEQMDQLFLNRGRPATTHQVFVGLLRGGVVGGPTTGIDPSFLKAVQQSDIRPEYANPLWHGRFNYPPLFQLGRLVAQGSMTAERARQIATWQAYDPEDVAALYAYWKRNSGGAAKELTAANLRAEYEGMFISQGELVSSLKALGYDDAEAQSLAHLGDAARVKKYRDAVVSAVHKAYLAHEMAASEARGRLSDVGISGEAQDEMLRLWNIELSIARKQLTDAQIAAAYRRKALNEADALAELELRGFTENDARTLLGLALPILTADQITKAYKAGDITRAQAIAQLEGQSYSEAQAVELVDTAVPPSATPPV